MCGNNCGTFFLKAFVYIVLMVTALADNASSTAAILLCFCFFDLLYTITMKNHGQNQQDQAEMRQLHEAVQRSALHGDFISFMGQAARDGYINSEQWLRVARICSSIRVDTHRALNALREEPPLTPEKRFAFKMTKLHDLRKKGLLEKECHEELQRMLIDDFRKHTPRPGVVERYRYVEPKPQVVEPAETPKEEPVIIEVIEEKEVAKPPQAPQPQPQPEIIQVVKIEEKREVAKPPQPPQPQAAVVEEKKVVQEPSTIATVVEAFMEEGNVKWIEVVGSLCYLLCFCFGILVLATRWAEFSPVLRYFGLLVLTAFVGLAAYLGKVYLDLSQTAHALAIVTTIIAPLNMLGANYLFFHDPKFIPSAFAFLVIGLAIVLVYVFHRWNTKVMLGQDCSIYGIGYPLFSLTLLYPLLGGGSAALALLSLLASSIVLSAISWYAIRKLYETNEDISFSRGFIVTGSLAWAFFLQAMTLSLVNNVTFQLGTWGIFIVLLSLILLTYPARRLCSNVKEDSALENLKLSYFAPGLPISQVYLVIASFALSLIGLLVSCENGFGGNYPLTLNLILLSVLYGTWALLTGIKGMMGLTTVTMTGLLLVIRVDSNFVGLLSLSSVPYLLATIGYLFCKCRQTLSDDEQALALELVSPFFITAIGFVFYLTLASFIDPSAGRLITLLFALTGAALSTVVDKRALWSFVSLEAWLSLVFFATTHLKLSGRGFDRVLVGLLPFLAIFSLIWSTIGYLTKNEWQKLPLVEELDKLDDHNPFSAVALLSVFCATFGLFFSFSAEMAEASYALTALCLAGSLLVRRFTLYAPYHEYGVASFVSYAFLTGPVRLIATNDEHWLTGCALLSLLFTAIAYFLAERTKSYHGKDSRHAFADVGLLWFLPPSFYLCSSPFWQLNSQCIALSGLALIISGYLISRLYKFWPYLYTTPVFLLIAIDCVLLGGLGHFGRGFCLSLLAVGMMLLSRSPRVRSLLGREMRHQGISTAAKPLAELNLVFTTVLFFAFVLPMSVYRLASHRSTMFTTFFSFSTNFNGPFWPMAFGTLLLIGTAYIGMARLFFFRDLLATVGWSIITVSVIGQLTRLLPSGSLTRWYPFVVILWAWALQSAWTQWPKTSKWAARRISLAISLYGFFILGYLRFVIDGSLRAAYPGLIQACLMVSPFVLAAAGAASLFYFLAYERKNSAYSLLIALSIVFAFTFLSAAIFPGPRVWGEAWGLLVSGTLLSLLAIKEHPFAKGIFVYFGLGLIILASCCGLTWELHVASARVAPLCLTFLCWLAYWLQHRFATSDLTHHCTCHGLLLFVCQLLYVVTYHVGYSVYDYGVQGAALFALIMAALANLWRTVELARLDEKNTNPWLTCWNALTLNSFGRTYALVATASSLAFLVTTFQTFKLLGFWQFLSAILTTIVLLLSIRPLDDERTTYIFNGLLNWSALCATCGLTLYSASSLGATRKFVLASLIAGATLGAMARLWQYLVDRATSKEGYTGRSFLGMDSNGLHITADITIWVSFFFGAIAFVASLAEGCQSGFVLQAFITSLVIAHAAHYRKTTIMSVALWLSTGWTLVALLWATISQLGGHHLCVTHGRAPETTLALTALFLTILSFLSNWAGLKLRESDEEDLKKWLDCDILQYLPYLTLIGTVSLVFILIADLRARPHLAIWLPSVLTLLGTAVFLGTAAQRHQREDLVYLTLALGGIIYGYLRLAHLIGVTFWGQLALVFASFALLGVSRYAKDQGLGIFTRPCYNVSLALPVFLVMRAGFGFGHVRWLGAPAIERFSLVAMAAAFYGIIGKDKVWASGVSLLLCNLALGVLWSLQFGLTDTARYLEFYTVPAGLTLILFGKIHSGWLSKKQISDLRQCGLLIIYAAPAWHCCGRVVTMYHFYALFSMGLIGFFAGMGLRIRHFFIYGLIFMVIALCSLLLNIVSIRLSTFAVAFFFVLAVAFFTHAALLRHYRDRYKELLDEFSSWE